MALTIDFHPRGHKWFPAPDFTGVALSDETKLSEALEIVLRAKRKSLMPAEKEQLINKIIKSAGGDNIGTLRGLDDEKWKQFNEDIPLICRIYLKHIIMQSCSLTFQQLLECDFNNGLPIDWKGMQEKVTQVLALGFSRDEALEALMVTSNKVEQAIQYLLSDPNTRKLERERAKKTQNKSVPPNRHYTIIEQQLKERLEQEILLGKPESELQLTLTQIKMNIQAEKNKREELEKQRDMIATRRRIELYTEFLKGIIADPKVNTAEQQRIETRRYQLKITSEEEKQVLNSLGYDEATFDALKKFEDVAKDQDECIVCYEPPRDHMLLPCHHVCLCPDCADEYRNHSDASCPLCNEPIKDIKQVFW